MGRDAWRTVALGASLAAASPALAAEPRYTLDIPPQALPAALVQLGLQAGVSISTGPAAACGPMRHRLTGRYSLGEALSRLLDGTGCDYRLLDSRAAEIRRATPPPPREPSRPPAPREAAPADLAEVVVVATGRPTPSDRLAYPVSGLAAAALEAQGVRDANEISQLTPGMTVTNLGAGRDKIILRGLSDGPLTGHSQSMVGVYLDDVRVTYNAPDPDLKLVDVSQVEVLRGPQGALYGSGSLGGVLHLVTGQPDPSRAAGWISAAQGWTHRGRGSTTFEGMINLPFASQYGAVRLAAWREDLGGYVDNLTLNARDTNHSIREGLRLSAGLRINADWRLTAGWVGQAINTRDTQYVTSATNPYGREGRLAEPHDNDFTMARVGIQGTPGWGEANLSFAWLRHSLATRYDASAAPPLPTAEPTVAFDDRDRVHSLLLEGRASAAAEASVPWLAGLFLADTRQDLYAVVTAAQDRRPLLEDVREDRLREAALFGQITWPLGPRITLTTGGRLFRMETTATSLLHATSGEATRYDAKVARQGFAPKLVIAYQASPALLIYAQAAQGYRAGGVNTLGASSREFGDVGGGQPSRLYRGDELWSVEVGGRLQLLEGRLRLAAAAFAADWRNIQSDQLQTSGLPYTANIGDGRNLGLEFEGALQAGRFSLRGAALLNAPELTRADPGFPARPELALAGAPEVSAAISGRYRQPLADSRLLEIDARVAYVGASNLTFDATTSPAMGDYVTGRLSASLIDPAWRMTIALDNPGDSAGDTFAFGNPFTVRTQSQSTPLRPRTLWFEVKRSF